MTTLCAACLTAHSCTKCDGQSIEGKFSSSQKSIESPCQKTVVIPYMTSLRPNIITKQDDGVLVRSSVPPPTIFQVLLYFRNIAFLNECCRLAQKPETSRTWTRPCSSEDIPADEHPLPLSAVHSRAFYGFFRTRMDHSKLHEVLTHSSFPHSAKDSPSFSLLRKQVQNHHMCGSSVQRHAKLPIMEWRLPRWALNRLRSRKTQQSL